MSRISRKHKRSMSVYDDITSIHYKHTLKFLTEQFNRSIYFPLIQTPQSLSLSILKIRFFNKFLPVKMNVVRSMNFFTALILEYSGKLEPDECNG